MDNFTWTDIGIVALQIFQIAIQSFYMYHFLTPKYSFEKCMSIATLVSGIGVCIGYLDFSNVVFRQLLHTGIYLCMGKKLYRDSMKRILFSFLVMAVTCIFDDWLVSILVKRMFPNAENYFTGVVLLAANLIFCVVHITSMYLVLIPWKKSKGEILSRSIYGVMLFPVSQLFLVEILVYDISHQFNRGEVEEHMLVLTLVGGLLCILADIILFRVILGDSQKERLAARLEMMERQTQAEYEYYNAISESREEIRRIRHDFNNQLQTAYSMVRDKEGGREAAQFLKELEQHIEEAAPAPRCANWIVNAVLQEKAKEAKERGVSLEGEVELPENCGIEKVDLCSVFSNLLDNAIRSAASCEKEKWVKVKSYQRGGYCMARVENACRAGEKRRDRRKGQDEWKEPGHGYGLLILQSIAEKYHGEFQTEKADGMFAAEIKLRREEERENEHEGTVM